MTELNNTREYRTESEPEGKRGGWYILIGLVLGLILGVAYTWIANPVVYETTAPSTLGETDKDAYRSLIAQVYAATGNLERATLRLEVLEDEDSVYTLGAQAQHVMAEGYADEARALALLASAIQQSPTIPTQTAIP